MKINFRNKSLIFASIGLFFVSLAFSKVQAESIVPDGVAHAESDNVTLNVNADSSLAVSENIVYVYGKQATAGWTRFIPLNYQDLDGAEINVNVSYVTVTDENNQPYVINQTQIQEGQKKYLAIDIQDKLGQAGETRTYVLSYKVDGALRFMQNNDELFWNATGDKWPVYVKYPEVTITLPQKVDPNQISKQCYIGIHKATMACIDRQGGKRDVVTDYSYKGVVAGEGMTTVVNFPKGLVQKKIVNVPTFWETLRDDRNVREIFMIKVFVLIFLLTVFLLKFKQINKLFKEKIYPFIFSKTIAFAKWLRLHRVHAHAKKHAAKLKNKSRKWWITIIVILVILIAAIVGVFWKVEMVMNKISTKGESVGSIVQATIPNQGQLKGEAYDRINVLLLGILGADHPGGGLNTDTIMVASIEPKENKISLVSIPRDLWVLDPGKDTKSKINSVYEYGEEKGPVKGIEDIKSKVSEITGLDIHYAAIVSTQGFAQLVDTLGGVDVTLSKAFDESAQFSDVNVCDDGVYTIPTGEMQQKKNKKGRVTAEYPLCKNANPECGGDFHLAAGKNTLGGQQALCFVRSRYQTSDFERSKRQQLILQQVKQKVTQLNIIDFAKVNSILDELGNNVQTDMQLWEMRRLFDLYKGMNDAKIYQRVLEDSNEGLLYSPEATPATGYILLPQGDNYDKIHELFANIFSEKNQSDIKPKI